MDHLKILCLVSKITLKNIRNPGILGGLIYVVENMYFCCLKKTCVKICVGEKIYKNTCNVV